MALEPQQRVSELFQAALGREPNQRAAFLAEVCAGDTALRAQVESLIASGQEAETLVMASAHKTAPSLPANRQTVSTAEQRIGPYKVIRELGHGGMGMVYLAARADDQYRKQVAIKLIKRGMDTDAILRRFRNERQILASLDHPNTARFLDGGVTEDGLPYFAMEHIKGESIIEYCDRHKLSTVERLKLFRQICSAVHYAHQNLVVHRDLKPSNILVTEEGVPKLLDFGIAKLLSSELAAQTLDPTAPGSVLMTPEYASPEQVRGEPITTASDVYSLGVVLYELLTGHHPFRAKWLLMHEIILKVCEEEPEKPSTVISRVKEVPSTDGSGLVKLTPESVSQTREGQPEKLRRRLAGDIDNIVLMALRKDPQRRYGSVEQFSEDIRRYLEGLPVIAHQDTLAYRSTKFLQRNKATVAVAAAFAVLVIGSIFSLTAQATRIARERDRAVGAERLAADQRTQAERARDAERGQRQQAEANLQRATDAEQRALAEAERANTEAKRAIVNLSRATEAEKQANTEAERAKAETERAKTEAETTKQVSEFLVGLFNVPDLSAEKMKAITARELLDKGAAKIREELKGQPKVQATLMNTMGQAYRALGLYDSALPLTETALKIRREALGGEHQDVASSLNSLAMLLGAKGDYAAAEPLQREALAMDRKLLGNEHPDVVSDLHNLATVLHSKGDYAAAESLYREALAMRRKLQGNEHPGVANILNSLGVLLQDKGDYAAAEPLIREALAMRRKILGNEHLSVARSLNNLAVLLQAKGDQTAAEPLLREALAIRRKLLGNEHPDVANSLNSLAVSLQSKGDYVAAEPLFREALATRRKLLGNEHPLVASNLNNLGMLLQAKGDHAAAEPLLREALAMNRKLLGDEHPNVATNLYSLANTLFAKNDYAGAEQLYRQTLQLQRKLWPKGHPRIPYTLISLGRLLTVKGDPKDAEPLLREGVDVMRKTLVEGSWETANAESVLGGCLVALHQYDEAEPLLVKSYPIIKARLGERNIQTQRALDRLIDLYQALGKPDKAAEYRALLPAAKAQAPPKP